MFRISKFLAAASVLLALSYAWAHAQNINVKDAWARSTAPGQKVGGAYMEITSKVAARLVGAASPAAASVEIHNMTMEGGVMKMFAVEGVDLPAGRTVKFAPGGYHIMLVDLKSGLKTGDRVPLKLTFELADRKRETLDLSVEVRDASGEARQVH